MGLKAATANMGFHSLPVTDNPVPRFHSPSITHQDPNGGKWSTSIPWAR